jgi:hypothetical protein
MELQVKTNLQRTTHDCDHSGCSTMAVFVFSPHEIATIMALTASTTPAIQKP